MRRFFRASLFGIAMMLATGASTLIAQAQPLTKIRFQLDWRIDGQTAPFFLWLSEGQFQRRGARCSVRSWLGLIARRGSRCLRRL